MSDVAPPSPARAPCAFFLLYIDPHCSLRCREKRKAGGKKKRTEQDHNVDSSKKKKTTVQHKKAAMKEANGKLQAVREKQAEANRKAEEDAVLHHLQGTSFLASVCLFNI